MQQHGFDGHGCGCGGRRAGQAPGGDQCDVEADIAGERHRIDGDAELLSPGHGQEHFGWTDKRFRHVAGKEDHHQHVTGGEGGAEEAEKQISEHQDDDADGQ